MVLCTLLLSEYKYECNDSGIPTGGYWSTVLIQLDSSNGWSMSYKSQKMPERRCTLLAIFHLEDAWTCLGGTTTVSSTGNIVYSLRCIALIPVWISSLCTGYILTSWSDYLISFKLQKALCYDMYWLISHVILSSFLQITSNTLYPISVRI